MIILLHAIIPHHHHSNKPVCINQLEHKDCNNHNNCCDFGGHKDNHDFDKGNCIIDDYFTPKESLTLTQTLTLTFIDFDLFNITTISDFILKDKGTEFRRNDLTIIYKNPLAINNIGLRAPPTC